MRTNPRYDDRLTFDPLAEAIMEATEKGVDWTHIEALLSILSKVGQIDAAAKWDKQGRSLLGALMGAHRSEYDSTVPRSILELALSMDPQALSRKDAGGNTPVDMFLDKLNSNGGGNSRFMESVSWWLEHADKKQLLSWVPLDRYGDHMKVEPNGYHVVRAVMSAEHAQDREIDHSLLGQVSKLGFDLNANSKGRPAPGTWIKHKGQWDAFVAHGGDPYQQVKDGDDKTRPLWRYVVERGQGSAKDAAKQWALENAGEEMKAKAYNDYWANLKDKARYSSVSPSDIAKHLTKHPDFLTLRDPKGRTPTMYGIQMHGSSFRTLEQKRFVEMNKERDNAGHSLWHYAFSKGKMMGGDMISFLIKSGAPMDPNPKTGRGWLASIVMEFKEGYNHDKWIRDAAGMKKLVKHSTFEQWWAMAEGDRETVMAGVHELLDDDKTRQAFNHVVCQFVDQIDDEELVDKALRYNISQYGGDNINANGVKAYFQRGMNTGSLDEDLQKIRGKVKAEDYAEIEAMVLGMKAPAVDLPRGRRPGL